MEDLKRCAMASWDGGGGGVPAGRTSHGTALEVKPHAGELSSSSEEGEGLKDVVGSGPSGCSDMSKPCLDVTVSRRGGDRECLLRPPRDEMHVLRP